MKLRTKAAAGLAAVMLCLLAGTRPAVAQTLTTGSISGTVADAQGGILPGATVVALHTPTGTSYEAVADGQGRYTILNVSVGPYDLTANMSGFRPEKQKEIAEKLG